MTIQTPSLRDLFEAARELRGPERAQFVAGVDGAQRAALERLLAADAEDACGGDPTSDPGLGIDAVAMAAVLAEPAPPPLPVAGQRIGSWQLVALLGEGGSATVFRAARDHAGVRQDAALKLLRRGLYTLDAQRQFRRERLALAQLTHPDIAHLIEGGVTENGLPYIALELVDGVPITDYARTHGLDLRARLRLFLRVCRAVESAHRALIVHRDLKPSNVFVSAEGHVKLLDFGIAKLLDADDDETQTRLPAFTPAYAAPEQRTGLPVTTATDVYALGILLGELLTGQRLSAPGARTPSHRIDEASATGVLPAAPKLTRKLLHGDVDNIILKATADEPARRYASAGAFADDLERLLDGRPVRAHPPSRRYLARKFVERHRVAVAATALFALATFATLALALWQAGIARREALRANTVRDFVVGVFDTARAHLPRDQRPTPETLVAQAQQRVKTATLDDATRADILSTLGEVSLSLANYSDAEALLHEAQQLHAGDAAAQRHMLILRAAAMQSAGRNDDAIAELERALPALRARASGDLQRALRVLATAEMARGQPERAVALQREAAAVARTLYGDDHVETLAAGLDVGNTLADAQRYPEAIAEFEPLLRRWRALRAPEDDRYVAALTSLAAAADGTGDSAASEARYRELLALKQRIYRAPHNAIASTLRELALMIGRDGTRGAESEALLDQALAMQREVYGGDHAEIAETHEARGNVLVAQRRFADAEAAYREALSICARAVLRSEVCPRAHNDLGMLFYRQDKLGEAESEMQLALAGRRGLFGDAHPTVAFSLGTLANVAMKKKEKQRAIELSAEALAAMRRSGRGASRDAVLIHNSYATALWWADRNAEALPEIEQTLADWQRVAPEATPRRAMMLLLKAQVLSDLKRADEARAVASAAIDLDVPRALLQPTTRRQLRELSGRSDAYPEDAANAN